MDFDALHLSMRANVVDLVLSHGSIIVTVLKFPVIAWTEGFVSPCRRSSWIVDPEGFIRFFGLVLQAFPSEISWPGNIMSRTLQAYPFLSSCQSRIFFNLHN